MFLKDWTYTLSDPGLKLFTLANAKLPAMEWPYDLFEIGCADTDFLARVSQFEPDVPVKGIDWRTTKEDALTAVIGPTDVFVSLSTIEHIGLGRYGDPMDEYGDIKVVQRMRDNLVSGGFIYFDVPYTPEGYGLLDVNKCRCYDDASLIARFGPHEVLGYTTPNVDGWVEKPTTNHEGVRPYWYVALLIRKDA